MYLLRYKSHFVHSLKRRSKVSQKLEIFGLKFICLATAKKKPNYHWRVDVVVHHIWGIATSYPIPHLSQKVAQLPLESRCCNSPHLRHRLRSAWLCWFWTSSPGGGLGSRSCLFSSGWEGDMVSARAKIHIHRKDKSSPSAIPQPDPVIRLFESPLGGTWLDHVDSFLIFYKEENRICHSRRIII